MTNPQRLVKNALRTVRNNFIPILLGILLLLSLKYFRYSEGFGAAIKRIEIPEIPTGIKEDMQTQIFDGAFNQAGYDWFTFYDQRFDAKVKVKLTGLSTHHYDSLSDASYRIEYDDATHRLKSLASEINYTNLQNNYSALNEIAVYNVAKEIYNFVPDGHLVSINGDKDRVMIEWDDEFPNSVREEDFVSWFQQVKNYLFAPDKQERYFATDWKSRNETRDDIPKEFIDLMGPIYDSFSKPASEFKTSKFDVENYYTYLGLSNIFGSGHMDAHNLLFIPDVKKDEFTWSMAPFDMLGLNQTNQPPLLMSTNPISQYFLRDPRTAFQFIKRLEELNNIVLKNHMISSFYNKYDCDEIARYPEFGALLMKSGTRQSLPMDTTVFCTVVDKLKDFEVIRSLDLENKFNESGVRWQLFEKDGMKYLSFEVPTQVGVKVTQIKCGIWPCKGNFELVNKPWWQGDDPFFLLPEIVRGGKSFRAPLVPGHFRYIYEWKGSRDIKAEDLTIKAENALTGRAVAPVFDFYPSAELVMKETVDEKGVFDAEFEILNNVANDPQFSMTKSDIEVAPSFEEKKDPSKAYTLVFDIDCKKQELGELKYTFDCTSLDIATWPYPILYNVTLYYQNMKVKTYIGEVFVPEPEIRAKNDVLGMTELDKLRTPSMETFLSDPDVKATIESFETVSGTSELSEALNRASAIYVVPAGAAYEVADDLKLDDNSILWLEGKSTLKVWPLVKIDVGTIVAAGDTDNPVVVTKNGAYGPWYGLTLAKGGYFNGFSIDSTLDNRGGIYAEDVEVVFLDSKIHGKYGVTCVNCFIHMKGVQFLSGDWGLNAKDSLLSIDGVTAASFINHVFVLEDTRGSIKNVTSDGSKGRANGTMDRVFEIIGSLTDLKIQNVDAKNANILFSTYLFPKVEMETVAFDGFNRRHLDLDREDIYDPLSKRNSDEFAKEYSYLKRDKQDKNKFYLENKRYEINSDLIVPEGITLSIRAGAELSFTKKAGILSYGKIVAEGTEKDPILFNAQDDEWGTLSIRGGRSSGAFKNCKFENGGENYIGGTLYTGALSAHKGSSLTVDNCEFTGNKGDDSVNCNASYCHIKNSKFTDNDFDAIDFDFSSGRIESNKFENNGNDAIDLSYDNSRVFNNVMLNSGDKGVSVGEGSNSIIFNNLIEGNNIGIELKDSTKEIIVNNTITKNKIGISAYMKKRAFGSGGVGEVYNTVLSDNETRTSLDKWSEVIEHPGYDSDIVESLGLIDESAVIYGLLNQ